VCCGRSVADPPNDPAVVDAAGGVAERLIALLNVAESLQPEHVLLQGVGESRGESAVFGLLDERPASTRCRASCARPRRRASWTG
jgi:hypothetical protein